MCNGDTMNVAEENHGATSRAWFLFVLAWLIAIARFRGPMESTVLDSFESGST